MDETNAELVRMETKLIEVVRDRDAAFFDACIARAMWIELMRKRFKV